MKMIMTRAAMLLRSILLLTASVTDGNPSSASLLSSSLSDPLLLRAACGDDSVTHTPVWMMRQAGRHMKAYRDLRDTYPTFRERSEIPEVSLAISLQPFEAYGVDGVILFSDILTPLPAMGVDFAISESGKIAIHPIRTREAFQQLNRVTSREYKSSCSFVGEVLEALRTQVPPRATVLGFVGLPFTLASYLVEGQTGVASGFPEVRSLIDKNPKLLHDILSLLAKNIADYACYQIDCGAQVIQVFDSWAGHMDDESYNVFCAPYQKRVVASIKSHSPKTPIIIYMAPGEYSRHGRRLALLAQTGADIVSVDHTVDIGVARKILPDSIGIQGNLDPQLLRDGPLEEIESHTIAILDKMAGRRHIMNLGHGILADTPEEHAAFFVSTVQSYKQ